MKTYKIIYWITTVSFCAVFIYSGFNDAVGNKTFIEHSLYLGYPEYFFQILGVADLIGVCLLLIPFKGRLKDWAYAGFTINLISAIWTHFVMDANKISALPAFVFLLILLGSYYSFLKLEKLSSQNL